MTRATLILIAFFSMIGFSACQPDTYLVKECFAKYKIAIHNRDGNTAINLIDKSTIDYYPRVLGEVKMFDSSQLEKEGISTRFLVLKIRHTIPRQQILDMNGKALLAALINFGISGNGNIDAYTIGKITLNGDSAEAEKISKNKKTPFLYLFFKETGIWKFRAIGSNSLNDMVFRQLIMDSNMKENDYIFKLLEAISGKKPALDIWKSIN